MMKLILFSLLVILFSASITFAEAVPSVSIDKEVVAASDRYIVTIEGFPLNSILNYREVHDGSGMTGYWGYGIRFTSDPLTWNSNIRYENPEGNYTVIVSDKEGNNIAKTHYKNLGMNFTAPSEKPPLFQEQIKNHTKKIKIFDTFKENTRNAIVGQNVHLARMSDKIFSMNNTVKASISEVNSMGIIVADLQNKTGGNAKTIKDDHKIFNNFKAEIQTNLNNITKLFSSNSTIFQDLKILRADVDRDFDNMITVQQKLADYERRIAALENP